MKVADILAITYWTIHLASALVEYVDDDLQTPMQLIGFFHDSNSVIVGARNQLYNLYPANLRLRAKQSTGPKLDHEKCSPIPDEDCAYDRVLTDDDPKFLTVNNVLLYCGTLYKGSCWLYNARTIGVPIMLGEYRFRVSNLVAGKESTVVTFGPGPGSTSTYYMYIASTYDDRPAAYFPASVSSRRIDWEEVKGEEHFFIKFSYDSKTRTAVNFHPDFKKSYKVNYVYTFHYKNFVYFVTTQRTSVTSNVIETRLARVCTEDTTFYSYMEIPLKCQQGETYNLATAAYLGQAGPILKGRLKMEGPSDVLYISFVRTVPENAYLVDKSKGSVLCSFPMSEVISHFTNAIRDCHNGEPSTFLLPHIVGDVIRCKNHSKVRINDDVCGTGENHFIEGREAIPGGVRSNMDAHVTSLAVTLQTNKTVAFLGTEKGDVIKLMLERTSGSPLYTENIASQVEGIDKSVQKSNTFDKDHQNLFLLTGNKVVKFPAGSCSLYKSCGNCLGSEDPLGCGWCGNHCAHYQECDAHGLFTRDFCPLFINDVKPLAGPTAGGTIVNITGYNFSSAESGEASSHIQVTVAGVECEIIVWTSTLLQCKTAAVEEQISGPVTVRVTDTPRSSEQFNTNGTTTSESDFKYLLPVVFGGMPSYGPLSGGTEFTFSGLHLDIGSSSSVTVAGVKCRNVSLTETYGSCFTGPSSDLVSGPIEMTIDNAHLQSTDNYQSWFRSGKISSTFQYKPDPELLGYHPNATTVSGTVNLTVTGKHFDSIHFPHLSVVVTILISGKVIRVNENCTVLNETLMSCRTPRLELDSIYTPTDRAPLLTQCQFHMVRTEWDRGKKTKDLPLLLYYPDPQYFSFDTPPEKVSFSQRELEIRGKNLDLAHSPDDVNVLIDGSVPCKVNKMQRESVFCLLPAAESLPTVNGSLHSVKVHINPLTFDLGTIEFVEDEAIEVVEDEGVSSSYTLIICISVIGFIIFFIFAMYAYVRKTRSRNKRHLGYIAAFNGSNHPSEPADCGKEPSEPARPTRNTYDAEPSRPLSVQPVDCVILDEDEERVHLLESKNLKIDRKYLTIEKELGRGNFGCVYKGVLSFPGKEPVEVAVKLVQKNAHGLGQGVITNLLDEGIMMKDFNHPNVLGLVGVCFESINRPMVIVPFMKYGDLHAYIGDESRDPDVLQLLNFGIDIAKGMAYLEKNKFVHRDLAARNCMLGEDMVVRVADFGLSRDIYEKQYYSSDNRKLLPVKWLAVESLEKGVYSSSSDVWSYGVVLWELMTRGVIPYPDVGNWDLLSYLKSGRRMLQPYCCPDRVYGIMLKCWEEYPENRPTFNELVVAMKSAVVRYQEEYKGKLQKVDIRVRYLNSPYGMLDESGSSRAENTDRTQEANSSESSSSCTE